MIRITDTGTMVPNYTKDQRFEANAMKTLVRHWFPGYAMSRINNVFRDETYGESLITWDWLKNRIECHRRLPDFSFCSDGPDKTAWKITLTELFSKGLSKSIIYEAWEANPSDAMVFPVVGKQAIIYDHSAFPDMELYAPLSIVECSEETLVLMEFKHFLDDPVWSDMELNIIEESYNG